MLDETMETGTPNLDAMASSDLMDFWASLNSVRPIRKARELFPSKPKGYVRVAKDLGNYASNKATAQVCRARGDIAIALSYEGICDRIYADLPEWARW